MSELEQLRQEAELLKSQIRVRGCIKKGAAGCAKEERFQEISLLSLHIVNPHVHVYT